MGQKQGLTCKSRRTLHICRPIKGSRVYGLHLQPLSRPGLSLRTPCLPPPGFDLSRRLPSMGLHRVGHDWSDLAAAAAAAAADSFRTIALSIPALDWLHLCWLDGLFLWASGNQTKSLVIGLDRYFVYPIITVMCHMPQSKTHVFQFILPKEWIACFLRLISSWFRRQSSEVKTWSSVPKVPPPLPL